MHCQPNPGDLGIALDDVDPVALITSRHAAAANDDHSGWPERPFHLSVAARAAA